MAENDKILHILSVCDCSKKGILPSDIPLESRSLRNVGHYGISASNMLKIPIKLLIFTLYIVIQYIQNILFTFSVVVCDCFVRNSAPDDNPDYK